MISSVLRESSRDTLHTYGFECRYAVDLFNWVSSYDFGQFGFERIYVINDESFTSIVALRKVAW